MRVSIFLLEQKKAFTVSGQGEFRSAAKS